MWLEVTCVHEYITQAKICMEKSLTLIIQHAFCYAIHIYSMTPHTVRERILQVNFKRGQVQVSALVLSIEFSPLVRAFFFVCSEKHKQRTSHALTVQINGKNLNLKLRAFAFQSAVSNSLRLINGNRDVIALARNPFTLSPAIFCVYVF